MKLSEFNFYIPEKIIEAAKNDDFSFDSIGMSKAKVLIGNKYVLKIDSIDSDLKHTYEIQNFLFGKLPVSKNVLYTEENETSYLLMEKIRGKMSCDESFLEKNSEYLTKLLTKGLKMLWQVPIDDCPFQNSLSEKLELAKYRVEHNLIDMENTEEFTFGENGLFKDPNELLSWLLENKPEITPVLGHGDFCLPNFFIENDDISGFIDLGRCGVSDIYEDIVICLRSFTHNLDGTYGGKVYPPFNRDLFFKELGIEPDEEKMKYFLLLDELF